MEHLWASLHVDDLVGGVDTLDGVFIRFEKPRLLLKQVGYSLRKFKSNSVYLENDVNLKYSGSLVCCQEDNTLDIMWGFDN